MGCSESRSVEGASGSGSSDKPQGDKPGSKINTKQGDKQDGDVTETEKRTDNAADTRTDTGLYVSEDEAIDYVMGELETTYTRAKRLVDFVQRDNDSRVSNQELMDLWGKIKEKKQEIKAEFLAMDADKSGYVSPDEAVPVLSKWFPGLPEESIRAMVKRYDTDDNGKMQYEEFIYFYGNMVAKREILETDFQCLEKENGGKLPSQDLVELLAKQCVLEQYMARALVEDCDINHDGIINRKEFQNLMNEMFG